MTTSESQVKGSIEWKVKVAAVATYLGALVLLSTLQAVSDDPSLFGGLPPWLGIISVPILPTLITSVSAYLARHTPRNDPDALQATLPGRDARRVL